MSRLCKTLLLAVFMVFLGIAACPAQAAKGSHAAMVERARTCGVFPGTIDRIGGAVLEGSLTDVQAEELLSVLVAVCDRKLPMAPFEDKVAEGLAKHVRPELIVRALKRKFDDYVFAHELLVNPDGKPDPQLLLVLAEGVSKGVPRQIFQEYVEAYKDMSADQLLTGAEMTSILSQAGFDFPLVRQMLDAGFKAGSLSPQWRYFVRIALIARKRGVDDATIARAAAEVLSSGGSPSGVSTHLGFTSRNLTGSDKE